jgi:hypothetical protein
MYTGALLAAGVSLYIHCAVRGSLMLSFHFIMKG